MPFRKMKWPKSEEKPKLGVGGVVMATPSPQCADPVPPNVKLVVQPLSAEVKDYSVGLKVPANNFRTNLVTGKMFTPLCFFCQGTPNYVNIDPKTSLSNLSLPNFTLGQGKFDLRPMSKTSKLCQDAYHSTRFDGTRVFILLCG